MNKEMYGVTIGSDGRKRIYMQDWIVQEGKRRQATKADIKRILDDIDTKRRLMDDALLEYVK